MVLVMAEMFSMLVLLKKTRLICNELSNLSNPAWSNVHVIVIDKDFTELQALQIEFPQASILYCQFHVIKCFFKQLTDLDVPKDNRDEAISSEGSKRTVQKCKKRRMYQPGTAANRLRIKRERRWKQMAGCTDNDGSNELSIVLPSGETESDSERTACMTVAGTALYPSDIGILQSSRKWLNERLINA